MATVPITHNTPIAQHTALLCYARSILESVSRYVLKFKAKLGPRGIIKDEFSNVFVQPSLMQCNIFVAWQIRGLTSNNVWRVHITIKCTLMLTTDICF